MTTQYAIHTILTGILSELETALIGTPGGAPGFSSLFPGEIVWDECCDGFLGITATECYLSDTFLSDAVSKMPTVSSNCKGNWFVVDITVNVLRCVPLPQGTDLDVSADVLTETSRLITADAWTIYNAMICYLQDLKDDNTIIEYSTTNLIFVGPQGGCVGCEMISSIALDLE